jgi:hypothetical protein
MKENWKKWHPGNNVEGIFYIDSVYDDDVNGFVVTLSKEKNEHELLKIIFSDSVESYKRTNESYNSGVLARIANQHSRAFYRDWIFFQVEHSDYLKNLSIESRGVSDTRNLMHFVITAIDTTLDIITNYEPTVEIIYEDKPSK